MSSASRAAHDSTRKNLMYVATEDELLKDREFVLYLKEEARTAFSAPPGERGRGFNTAMRRWWKP